MILKTNFIKNIYFSHITQLLNRYYVYFSILPIYCLQLNNITGNCRKTIVTL